MARNVGRCCSGLRCQFPSMELLKQHECADCKNILHVMCAEWDQALEKHVCFPCMSKRSSASVASPDSAPTSPISPDYPPPDMSSDKWRSAGPAPLVPAGVLVAGKVTRVVQKKTAGKEKNSKLCKACGGTDHQRRSSLLCSKNPKFSTKIKPKTKSISANDSTSVSLDAPRDKGLDVDAKAAEVLATLDDSENLVLEEEEDNLSKPNFVNVGDATQEYTPVIDIASPDFEPVNTTFRLASADDTAIIPTAGTLMEAYWSRDLIKALVRSSNAYRWKVKTSKPDLKYWGQTRNTRPFTIACMYHFLAILYYFGIVRLPSKRDYWADEKYMPQHLITKELGMSRDRFNFLWRHFHVSSDDLDEVEEVNESETENEELVEQTIERVVRNQDDGDFFEEEQTEEEINLPVQEAVWFSKLKAIIDHTRAVSASLIWVLGTILSLDEMMIRFMGRSCETHRIKGKPIGEGFKWFVLTTKQGFIVNFTPDGRSAAKNDTQEYAKGKKGVGKVESMILFVTDIIDTFKTKQTN